MPRDGWASRQIANTEQNIREWPEWMQKYLNPADIADTEPGTIDEAFWGRMCARLMKQLEGDSERIKALETERDHWHHEFILRDGHYDKLVERYKATEAELGRAERRVTELEDDYQVSVDIERQTTEALGRARKRIETFEESEAELSRCINRWAERYNALISSVQKQIKETCQACNDDVPLVTREGQPLRPRGHTRRGWCKANALHESLANVRE